MVILASLKINIVVVDIFSNSCETQEDTCGGVVVKLVGSISFLSGIVSAAKNCQPFHMRVCACEAEVRCLIGGTAWEHVLDSGSMC